MLIVTSKVLTTFCSPVVVGMSAHGVRTGMPSMTDIGIYNMQNTNEMLTVTS